MMIVPLSEIGKVADLCGIRMNFGETFEETFSF